MKISEVEKRTGLTARAIRLYEEKGFINVSRRENSYRDYTEEDVSKLMIVQSFRKMGISLSQISLYFSGVITLEEILNRRKKEMEQENIFHRETYNKCVEYINTLGNAGNGTMFLPKVENEAEAALGLDIGTTNISAAVVEISSGKTLETYVLPNGSKLPSESDFAEFNADWIADKVILIADYLLKLYPNIKCIGVTGQMHGIVYLSGDGRAVSPLYNWQDGRANRLFSENKTYCDEIFDRTEYKCSSGYGFATMFYNKINAALPKDAKTFCSVTDYAVMKLANLKKPLVHASNAASFGMYSIENNCFDMSAVEKLGLNNLEMPEIAEKDSVAGNYNGVPVCVSIGDNQASFFASVQNEESGALINFGTGSQVSVVSDNISEVDKNLEIRPYLFGKFLVCGSALCGGKAYAIVEKFFSEYIFAANGKSEPQYELMNKLANDEYEKGEYLSVSSLFCGTRQEPALRGSITGVDDKNFTPGKLILGVLYAMANELKGYFDLAEHSRIKSISASGNAVKRNAVLQKVLKDVFKTEIHLTESDEEAAIGAALYSVRVAK